mgnify:FL=1
MLKEPWKRFVAFTHKHESEREKTKKIAHEFHPPLRELIRIKARSGFSSIFASTFVTCKLFFYPYYWLTLLQCHRHFGCVCCVVKWIRRNKYWRVTLFALLSAALLKFVIHANAMKTMAIIKKIYQNIKCSYSICGLGDESSDSFYPLIKLH